LINFTVTESGLEDQLLDLVVGKERPDLAQQKVDLIQQMNNFKITLGDLEEDLLFSLANSTGDILDDVPLVEKLEKAKMLSVEIAAKIEISKETSIQIRDASEAYRPSANRGALVFFMLNELYMIHDFYKFSLDSFVIVVQRAIDIVAAELAPKAPKPKGEDEEDEPEEENSDEEEGDKGMTPRTLKKRVDAITESITYQGYNYTRRGTFEKHKLLVATMLCLRIQVRKGALNADEVHALVMKEPALDGPSQPESLKVINETLWPGVVGLQKLAIFSDLCRQMENEAL
jgi:dynein heavy chain, axonemal